MYLSTCTSYLSYSDGTVRIKKRPDIDKLFKLVSSQLQKRIRSVYNFGDGTALLFLLRGRGNLLMYPSVRKSVNPPITEINNSHADTLK